MLWKHLVSVAANRCGLMPGEYTTIMAAGIVDLQSSFHVITGTDNESVGTCTILVPNEVERWLRILVETSRDYVKMRMLMQVFPA